ncbi:MAG: tRNA preQ1(34) S-adenosylmethionine ribosyltransferase-isomerase QueA [Candidatus Schekmanbacteria bacterium]|nr:tRNA preQ1(34) S-adenosylmethionine ribosyltransferase-isomerase QueA [Candidatus Schekmanbacteria bacterium]
MIEYELPPELIATAPAHPRRASRLLDARADRLSHHKFADLPELLQAGDLLVLNASHVFHARIVGHRTDTGGKVEALLLAPPVAGTARALMKPARRLRPGTPLRFAGPSGTVDATIAGRVEDTFELVFAADVDRCDAGIVPLPPYILAQRRRRGEPLLTAEDENSYQTVFACREPGRGSVAAPTAGLHFDEELFERLRACGVSWAFVHLDVGPATFRPVGAEQAGSLKLPPERFSIPAETLDRLGRMASARGDAAGEKWHGRIVAIGTTSVRALEALAAHVLRDHGGHLGAGLQALSRTLGDAALEGWADVTITPGYRFRLVDLLVTNFHLPRSSLLLLVTAFAGERQTRIAYDVAVERRYRFYSYGDAMLLAPGPEEGRQ